MGRSQAIKSQAERDANVTIQGWHSRGRICKYSPSCFTCPLADCVMSGNNINILPGEIHERRTTRG